MSKKTPAAVALVLAAAVAAPVATASAAPVADLKLSQPRPSAALDELVLRATCSEACTLRLRELNAVPYRTRGGREQLPHSAIDALSITRRLPARKQVAIRFAVPPAVQRAAAEAGPRGIALVGYLVAEVSPAGGGEPVQTPRQFTVTGPGTPAPLPASPYTDAIRLPKETTRRAASVPRYAMTIEGVQRSSWSYDRTSTDGGCVVLDRGSGRQTVTFRSLRAHTVQQVIWRTGELKLQEVGRSYSGIFVPVALTAERDSRAEKGADGDCGGVGGGGGDGGQQQCTRSGTAQIDMIVGLLWREALFSAGSSILNWKEGSRAPDCPVESATSLRDPIDILDAQTRRGEDLTRGGDPGRVIIVLRARDVTSIGGGSVTTTVRTTVTFRKLRQRSSSVM